MTREYHEYPNDILLILAAHNDHNAHKERLIREVMDINQFCWNDANRKVAEISETNKENMFMYSMPYRIGATAAVVAGLASIPLVFHLDTALWFNDHFVTTDVASPEELETPLEVGIWTWQWMEPPLGQISFLLLTLQYARSQMHCLGSRPYAGWLQTKRANRLCELYPYYNRNIVRDFAISDRKDA
jgi:hypothetical protein